MAKWAATASGAADRVQQQEVAAVDVEGAPDERWQRRKGDDERQGAEPRVLEPQVVDEPRSGTDDQQQERHEPQRNALANCTEQRYDDRNSEQTRIDEP